jgi:hypothetical protein
MHFLHGWGIHVPLLDKEDRYYGAPLYRVHCNTPWFHFAFALRPKDRFGFVTGNKWAMFRRWDRKDCRKCK